MAIKSWGETHLQLLSIKTCNNSQFQLQTFQSVLIRQSKIKPIPCIWNSFPVMINICNGIEAE
jgi:hypothetical protein